MPMIDLTVVRGSIGDAALARLGDELVGILLRAEGADDSDFLREHTWVYVHQIEPTDLSIGGRGPGAPRFRVELTVFDGILTKDRKESLVKETYVAVATAAGFEPKSERALHVWTVIHEVPDGNWAAGGRIAYRKNIEGLTTTDPT